MGQIVQIEVRPDMLIEMLSRAVLQCRREMNGLADNAIAVFNDADKYRRLLRDMDTTIDVIKALRDFSAEKLVKIGVSEEWCEDGVTLVFRRRGDD